MGLKPLIGVTKVCRMCREEKDISLFHPNKSCRLGVTGTCAICSHIRVAQWYKNNRDRRQKVANTKNQIKKQKAVDHFGNKCHDCGKAYPQYVFQFHHLDSKEKDMNPSAALSGSEETMWKELKKCIMLCANCHIERHFGKGAVDETTH